MLSGRGIGIIFSFFLMIVSSWIIVDSYKLSVGNLKDPGPGFLPLWLGIILGAMALGLLLKATWQEEGSKTLREIWGKRIRWGKVLFVLLLLILFGALLDSAGFLIVTFLFMSSLLRFVDPQPWRSVMGWALGGTLGCYLIFEVWLRLRFPSGILGF